MTFDEIRASIELNLVFSKFKIIKEEKKSPWFWIALKKTNIGNYLCHYEIVATTDRINIINEKKNFNEQEHFINLEIHFEDYSNQYPVVLNKIQQEQFLLKKQIIDRKPTLNNKVNYKQIGIIYASYKANNPILIQALISDLYEMNKKLKKEFPKFIRQLFP